MICQGRTGGRSSGLASLRVTGVAGTLRNGATSAAERYHGENNAPGDAHHVQSLLEPQASIFLPMYGLAIFSSV